MWKGKVVGGVGTCGVPDRKLSWAGRRGTDRGGDKRGQKQEEAGGAGTDGGVEGLGSGQSEVWKDHGDRRE